MWINLLISDNKRLDEWVSVDRLNLDKLQPPKIEEKKKSATSSQSQSLSKNQSKQNLSKNQQQSLSQPLATPNSPDVEPVNGTMVRNKSSNNLFGRKRKGAPIDEVKYL